MQIRAATQEDLAEVSAIYDHHARSSVSTFDDESPGPERWMSKVGDERRRGEHLLVVVAEDGEVRGYAESSVFRDRPSYEHTREVSVYLGLDVRQQGFGRRLYDELLEQLRADGVHVALAVIALPNEASETAAPGVRVHPGRRGRGGRLEVRRLGRHGVLAAAARRGDPRLMMIRPSELRAIQEGAIDLAFRRWERPRVVVGTRMRTGVGLVEVTSVSEVAVESLTEEDARRAGSPSLEALVAALAQKSDKPAWRVGLRHAGADPRAELRSAVPTKDEVAAIVARLERLDRASSYGAWTRETLDLIDRNPERRAPDLAAKVGRETAAFKTDVRKLEGAGADGVAGDRVPTVAPWRGRRRPAARPAAQAATSSRRHAPSPVDRRARDPRAAGGRPDLASSRWQRSPRPSCSPCTASARSPSPGSVRPWPTRGCRTGSSDLRFGSLGGGVPG